MTKQEMEVPNSCEKMSRFMTRLSVCITFYSVFFILVSDVHVKVACPCNFSM